MDDFYFTDSWLPPHSPPLLSLFLGSGKKRPGVLMCKMKELLILTSILTYTVPFDKFHIKRIMLENAQVWKIP